MAGSELSAVVITVLHQMRRRLALIFILLTLSSTAGYFLSDTVMSHLFALVRQVIFISPAEAFVTKIKVAVAIGFIFVLPVLIYMAVNALGKRGHNLSFKVQIFFTAASCLLFLLGAAFCYYAILPVAITFLLGFATLEMQPMLSAGRFVSFVLMSILMFGITFELPMLIMLLAKLGIIDQDTLRSKRRYAILAIFIVAGILTPSPDILSQIIMAVPLLVLYEAGIFLTRFCRPKETEGHEMPAEQQQLFM